MKRKPISYSELFPAQEGLRLPSPPVAPDIRPLYAIIGIKPDGTPDGIMSISNKGPMGWVTHPFITMQESILASMIPTAQAAAKRMGYTLRIMHYQSPEDVTARMLLRYGGDGEDEGGS